MINDINSVNNMYNLIVPDEYKDKYYNPVKYPVIYGYNAVTSYRNGGKTTNILIYSLCAWSLYGSKLSYIRTSSSMITESKIMTLYDALNTTVDDNGKNYVQKITNDRFDHIYYLPRKKVFVIANETSSADEIKNAPVICYVHSIDNSDKYRSGFADTSLDIILYDECMDKEVNSKSFIDFMHIISTFYRNRYKSLIFLCCNMSTGKPVIFQSLGIYTKVLAQEQPFRIYTTEMGTKVSVEILEVSESFSLEREKMNTTFFGFNIDGMEIIRGSSVTHDIYRDIQPDDYLTDMNVCIYTCGVLLRLYRLTRDNWQPMYAVKQIPTKPENTIVTVTDDKVYAYENPKTYLNICRDFKTCVDFVKAVRRHDVCYDNYLTMVYAESFLDNYKIGEYI